MTKQDKQTIENSFHGCLSVFWNFYQISFFLRVRVTSVINPIYPSHLLECGRYELPRFSVVHPGHMTSFGQYILRLCVSLSCQKRICFGTEASRMFFPWPHLTSRTPDTSGSVSLGPRKIQSRTLSQYITQVRKNLVMLSWDLEILCYYSIT